MVMQLVRADWNKRIRKKSRQFIRLAYLKGRMLSLRILDHNWKFYHILIFLLSALTLHCNSDERVIKEAQALEYRFFRAVDTGNLKEVENCLQEGLPVDKKDPRGNSGLIHAVDHENLILVQMLIERGANVNLRNVVGETALYRAVFRGNLNLVKFLVEKGAETKIKNIEGISPAHLADERGEENIQNFLEKSSK